MEKRTTAELRALPKPRNTAELEALSEWYFGKPLHLASLRVWAGGGHYDIAEDYNEYHGEGWLHSEHCIRGYDYSRAFWKHVFGELSCGGIARSSYGSFDAAKGYREALRLQSLQDSWRRKDAGRVRKSLARLAPNNGGGESAGIRGNRTLTSGRVDGADAAARKGSAKARASRASPEGTRPERARSAKPIARGAAQRQAPTPSRPNPTPQTIQGERP